MDEKIIKYIDNLTPLEVFKLISCEGEFCFNYDSDLERIEYYLKHYNFYEFNNKINFKRAVRINKDFFDSKLPLQKILCRVNDIVAVNISPFYLTINFVENFPELGKVHFKTDGEKTVFSSITLDNRLKSNVIGFYAHELVHTQIEKNLFFLLENYFDREVLSIFIELVISNFCNGVYERNTFDKRLSILKRQLNIIKNNTNDLVIRSYIVSTLKAYHLYNIYVNGYEELRSEILNDCEKVFKEERSVENILDTYEVNYENSKDIKYLRKNNRL